MANIDWGPPKPGQTDSANGDELPGDQNAPDIVGRTGEEMPDVAHDGTDHENDEMGLGSGDAVPDSQPAPRHRHRR